MRKTWLFVSTSGLVALLMVPGLTSHAQKSSETLTLLYSNNINGEIEPCPT